MKTIFVLIVFLLSTCSREPADKKVSSIPNLRDGNPFLLNNRDSVEKYIDQIDSIIASGEINAAILMEKYTYHCAIGEIDSSISIMSRIVYGYGNFYAIMNSFYLYDKFGFLDSTDFYKHLSYDSFYNKCGKLSCNNSDSINFALFRFYIGDINEKEVIDMINGSADHEDALLYTDMIKHFDREDFLNSHCQKTVDE